MVTHKLYWNCNVGETVKTFIQKTVVHEICDDKKKDKKDFLQGWLLGDKNLISDHHIVENWGKITCDRKIINEVAKYVVGNCESMDIKSGKIC